ncbi:glycoside hydrolase family 3 N-terminal domain-containing protein [Carnobacterium sp. TMP28]|uniref:glycoside hydrolase family 3 N-terminal domain-containing protein n=1 Tax=Carnobacterium sp. TMP28 TaxID=3397060 RepID=UPI0039DF90CB
MEEMQLKQLLKKMTLEEKIGQTIQLSGEFFISEASEITGPMTEMHIDAERLKGVGSVLGVSGATAVIDIQTRHLKNNRLGIPLLFMADVIHGYQTIFPIPLGLASSWNLVLAEQTAEIAAREAAVAGLHVTFSPMADLVRDARWGRVMEATGEDAYLNALYARAFVRGYQGQDLLNDTTKVAACVKHFAAYGAPIAGREYNTVNMSERQLRELYLSAYQAAIDEGSKLVMTAFNTVDGVPATGNKWLMNQVLREEMKFNGVLISDWGAIGELVPHGVAADLKEAGDLAMNAGVDIEMMSAAYSGHLAELITEETLDLDLLDEAVLRILMLKNDLGLFEQPLRGADIQKEKAMIGSQEHRLAAQQAAEQSIVLLKNEGVLPLKVTQKIALLGPGATSKDILGNWSWKGKTEESVSLAEGLARCLPRENLLIDTSTDYFELSETQLKTAFKLAEQADVLVLALGETADMSGEAASRTNIQLPASQLHLLTELKKLNKPLVVTLYNGRPLDLTAVTAKADALVEAWFPGSQGGDALANILMGQVNPSGKLTMSFPRTLGQVPIYYNADNTGRPLTEANKDQRYVSKYYDSENSPLFPFGFGLSYSRFSYKTMQLSTTELSETEELTVRVHVKNDSSIEGTEIVQLYLRDKVGEVVRPVKELKRFERVTLSAGEEQEVCFTLQEKDLRYVHSDLTKRSDKGMFDIMVGTSSDTTQLQTITLL